MIVRTVLPPGLIAAALLMAAACTPSPRPPAPVIQPIAYTLEDGRLTTKLNLDPALRAYPALRARLYEDGMTVLRTFEAEARAAGPGDGGESWNNMEMTVDWEAPVETTRLVGVAGSEWSFTGGAHGNPGYKALLWDRTAHRPVAAAALFRADADLSILDRALCDATNAAKAMEGSDPVAYPGAQGESYWVCPAALETPFSLAPGTSPGKAGGLVFLIGPYIVGPWSEGSHTVAVPAAAFSALLSPEWGDQFGGAPTPEFLARLRAEATP